DVVARRNDDIATSVGDARKALNALTGALADLKEELARLRESAVTRREFDSVANRLVALERSTTENSAELARLAAKETRDRAARFALAATALRAVLEQGDPFVSELTAAKAFAPDSAALAPLDAFAKSGMPTAATLGQELAVLIPALTQAVGAPARDGY